MTNSLLCPYCGEYWTMCCCPKEEQEADDGQA